MSSPCFVFHHEWVLPAPTDRVVGLLADVEGYPRWWPQVRRVEPVAERAGRVVVRSLLPMSLHLLLTPEIEDREGGLLRVRVDGDLLGWVQWSVALRDGRGRPPQGPHRGAGCVATLDQDVRVAARLSRAATLAPMVLRANHAWMMRQGRRGLAVELRRRR